MPATLSIQSGADQQESVYSQSEKCDSPASDLNASEATLKAPQEHLQSGSSSVVDNQSAVTLGLSSPTGPRVKFERSKDADTPSRPASSEAPSQVLDLEALATKPSVDEWKPQKSEWFIMISLSIISLMVALDATILVTVLPEISHALHGSSIDAFWAGTSYLLTSAVFQPVIASLSQYFGRQQALIVSLFFFTLGTILCAVADNFPVMHAGRSIQGIGGGGIITMNQVIFCDIVPLRQRPQYFAISLGAWAIGSILGPVVGGALCENTTWRWVFYINFPFCGLGFILAFVFVKLNAVTELTLAQKLQKTDWLGAFLFVGGMTSFLVGLSWGGIQYPWRSAETLVPIIVGLLAVGAFIAWQLYKKENSLLPTRIFSNRSALSAFYCALVNGLVLFSALYYFPFYSMAIRSSSPIRAGVETLPGLVFLVPGSIVVARITTRIGRFRWAIWGGWVLSTIGLGLSIMYDEHTQFAVIATGLAIFGIGAGMIITSVNVGIQAISKAEDNAMAASMYGFMRSLGMPIGVAISGTLFQNQMSNKLTEFGLPTSIAYDSERYMFELRAMAPDDPMRINVEASYVHGFKSVWTLVTAISGSAMVISLLIKKYDMNKKLQSRYSVRDISELRPAA